MPGREFLQPFVATARAADADLTIVDVSGGRHSFDHLDHTDGSRRAVTTAVDRVVALLTAR